MIRRTQIPILVSAVSSYLQFFVSCNCAPFPRSPSQMYSFPSWLRTWCALCFLTEKSIRFVFFTILMQNQWRWKNVFCENCCPISNLLLWQLNTSSCEGCPLGPCLPFRVSTNRPECSTKALFGLCLWSCITSLHLLFSLKKASKLYCKGHSFSGITLKKKKKKVTKRMYYRAWILRRKAAANFGSSMRVSCVAKIWMKEWKN